MAQPKPFRALGVRVVDANSEFVAVFVEEAAAQRYVAIENSWDEILEFNNLCRGVFEVATQPTVNPTYKRARELYDKLMGVFK